MILQIPFVAKHLLYNIVGEIKTPHTRSLTIIGVFSLFSNALVNCPMRKTLPRTTGCTHDSSPFINVQTTAGTI